MKFKLLLVAISFIPALVLAQQAPATPPPVTYSPPPSNTANSNKAIIPGTAPAPAKSAPTQRPKSLDEVVAEGLNNLFPPPPVVLK